MVYGFVKGILFHWNYCHHELKRFVKLQLILRSFLVINVWKLIIITFDQPMISLQDDKKPTENPISSCTPDLVENEVVATTLSRAQSNKYETTNWVIKIVLIAIR